MQYPSIRHPGIGLKFSEALGIWSWEYVEIYVYMTVDSDNLAFG